MYYFGKREMSRRAFRYFNQVLAFRMGLVRQQEKMLDKTITAEASLARITLDMYTYSGYIVGGF